MFEESLVESAALLRTRNRIPALPSVSAQLLAAAAILTLLQAAALDAVRQAHYHPFLLNGQPTAVQTTITINFRLGR